MIVPSLLRPPAGAERDGAHRPAVLGAVTGRQRAGGRLRQDVREVTAAVRSWSKIPGGRRGPDVRAGGWAVTRVSAEMTAPTSGIARPAPAGPGERTGADHGGGTPAGGAAEAGRIPNRKRVTRLRRTPYSYSRRITASEPVTITAYSTAIGARHPVTP